MTAKKVSITLDEKQFVTFRNYCAYKGYTVSSRIGVLIQNDLDNDRKTSVKLKNTWDDATKDIREEWNGIFSDTRKKGK